MSILSSAKAGKYSIPISEETLLKNNFHCAQGKDIPEFASSDFDIMSFVGSITGVSGSDRYTRRYRHSVYEALYIDTKREGSDEQGNPKIVGYIGVSTPIDLIDNGIWNLDVEKIFEAFQPAYYEFHEYLMNNGCMANVNAKTKVESLGSVLDFISSNKPYFLAVKRLKRNILLRMGLI